MLMATLCGRLRLKGYDFGHAGIWFRWPQDHRRETNGALYLLAAAIRQRQLKSESLRLGCCTT
jgi:hypothetical protein